jgi:DNA-binding transcriptional LysR family regulator
MLERYELEAFLTLAEELHFGRTAERMSVSTARVSQAIRKLERRVGAPLFNRTSRRVELTPIGRRLYDDLRPAREMIEAGLERAVRSGRGVTGTLHVGFVGAAGGQLLSEAAELLHARQPGCEVVVREVQLVDAVPWLLSGEVEMLLTCFASERDDLVTGPPLVTEARMLAVPSGHPFADRRSISIEDLAGVTLLRTPDDLPGSPPMPSAPAEPPTESGPAVGSFQEALTLVGAGRGLLPIGAHIRRYYVRPDVSYVLISDAPPVHWRLVWRADGATARVRAFAAAAQDVVTTAASAP